MSVKQYDSTNKILKLIAGGTLWADCPLGTINAFGGATAPEGWMLCQGQALSRTDYKDLFDVIGTAFGSGDGSTTFNLPDFRGEFLRGAGTNSHSGQGNGGSVGTHQDATEERNDGGVASNGTLRATSLPSIWIATNADTTTRKEVTEYQYSSSSSTTASDVVTYTARPTNTSVNFIIKAIQAPMPADLKAALEAALDNKDMLVWN